MKLSWLLLLPILLITACSPADLDNSAQNSPINSNGIFSPAEIQLPTTPHLPQIAENFITDAEVSSTINNHNYYDKHYQTATFAGIGSGLTIAIGVDLGQQSAEVTEDCWKSYLIAENVKRLASCANILDSSSVKELVHELQDIVIPWDIAINEFDHYEVPSYWSLTRRTFPGFDNLTLNAQGALVATVYNRGSSMAGSSRIDMRTIRTLVNQPNPDYKAIANALRHMSVTMRSTWEDEGVYDGLKARYDATALLAETPDS